MSVHKDIFIDKMFLVTEVKTGQRRLQKEEVDEISTPTTDDIKYV